jgi:oligopeptide/dipeptide ABC transporter ATP-binding protein
MSAQPKVQPAEPVLEVTDLAVEFRTHGGIVQAVRGASFSVHAGKTLAIVGESGCGKSVTVQSIMGLIPMPPGRITRGRALFRGVDILERKVIDGRDVRGSRIGMIFQDPMSSLNPTMKVGDQIAETLIVHRGYSSKSARSHAVELLQSVNIPEAERRAQQYPFAFSGGMLQRAMIAMAIACEPAVLIADEPTTALDVTIQAQILELLRRLQGELGMSVLLITHDLGLVAEYADEVVVMYAGRVVESAPVRTLFADPRHPYTRGLLGSLPRVGQPRGARLVTIEGMVPDLRRLPPGCRFAGRCPMVISACREAEPELRPLDPKHSARCIRAEELDS